MKRRTFGPPAVGALIAVTALAMAAPACGHATSHGAPGAGGASTSSSSSTAAGTGGASTSSGSGGASDGWVPPPTVVVPPLPPPPDYSNLPVDGMGNPILSAGPNVYIAVNGSPDAITARELCADLVANCFSPGTRSLDACMLSAPRCQTSQPWTESSPCCADACWSAYAALRTAGTDPLTAYLRVLYKSPICMPGVDVLLGGGP